jgi:hypothetical protein
MLARKKRMFVPINSTCTFGLWLGPVWWAAHIPPRCQNIGILECFILLGEKDFADMFTLRISDGEATLYYLCGSSVITGVFLLDRQKS